MHDETHCTEQSSVDRQPDDWFGELCDILASEKLFRVPNCEILLDRLMADRGVRS
ncbi:MAG: hypothetical protein R3D85_07010 [Paracoccaceae bacterium]